MLKIAEPLACSRCGQRSCGKRRQRRYHEGLARGAHQLRPAKLLDAPIMREKRIHKAADGEHHHAKSNDQAGVDPSHDKRHQRKDRKLGQAHPHHDLAHLHCIVSLDLCEIDRKYVDASVQHDSQDKTDKRDTGEATPQK
jgi:hypothetical protein